jgi:hypothetical protein
VRKRMMPSHRLKGISMYDSSVVSSGVNAMSNNCL